MPLPCYGLAPVLSYEGRVTGLATFCNEMCFTAARDVSLALLQSCYLWAAGHLWQSGSRRSGAMLWADLHPAPSAAM